MSSNGGAQKEQRKQKNLEAKRKQLENARSYSGILKAMKYMVPLPADNGALVDNDEFAEYGRKTFVLLQSGVVEIKNRNFSAKTTNFSL